MGLGGLGEFEKQEEAAKTSRTESPYFKLDAGQTVKIRPLVELGTNGASYNPDKPTEVANFVREYQNPVKFWLTVVDTYDPTDEDSRSVGYEMTQEFGWFKAKEADPEKNQHGDKTKNWNPKRRFYLPILVDRLDGKKPTVEVVQWTYGEKAHSQALVDFYKTKGTATDRWWTYSRNSANPKKDGLDKVAYKLVPDDPTELDTSKYEIPNVHDAPYVNNVPYEDQRAFLKIDETYRNRGNSSVSESSSSTEVSSNKNSDDNW